tara:strand:+ start:6777 stop:7220 length:444 start_codon:yes stop_codon:yes gene_type:complete
MKLSEILDEWAKDSKIDETQLDVESLHIPQLHHKYWKILIGETLRLRKIKSELDSLRNMKMEYYAGNLNGTDILDELGWEPWRKTAQLKADVQRWVDADSDIVDQTLVQAMVEEKIKLLDSIIRSINTRNFVIKNAIDFLKFSNGGF